MGKKLQGVKRNKSYLQSAITFLQKDAGVDGKIECDICYDAKIINEVRILQCGHHFCSGCVNKLLNENDACPCCRNIIACEKPQNIGKKKNKDREKLVEGAIEKILSLSTNEMRSRAINYLKKDLSLYNGSNRLLLKKEKIKDVLVEEVETVSLQSLPHNKSPRKPKKTKLEQGVRLFEQMCAGLKKMFPYLVKQTIRIYSRKPSILQIFNLPETISPILQSVLSLDWIGRSWVFSCVQNDSVPVMLPNPESFRSYLSFICVFIIIETTIRVFLWIGKSKRSVQIQVLLSAVGWFIYIFHISCQFLSLLIPSLLKLMGVMLPPFSTEAIALMLWIIILY